MLRKMSEKTGWILSKESMLILVTANHGFNTCFADQERLFVTKRL